MKTARSTVAVDIGDLTNRGAVAKVEGAVTGGNHWTGTYELKPALWGNSGDPPDEFDMVYDKVNLTETNGQSMLLHGLYDFENDTVGGQPANLPVFKGFYRVLRK